MKLIDRLQDDLKKSLRAKDGLRTSVLRLLLSSVKNREIEKKASLDDEEILTVISSSAKRRRESIEAFSEGGREDLVEKETAELEVLKEYLPEQMSNEEISSMVKTAISDMDASSPGDIGRVMSEIMPKVRGRADGKRVNQIARKLLEDKGAG